MTMRNATVVASVVAFLLARPSSAQSPDESTRAAVRSLAAEGDALMEKNDYADALERFQRASALIAAPTVRLREAVCMEKLGRWIEATDLYRQVSRTQLEASASDAFREAVRQAGRNAAALEAKLPKVVIVLQGDDLEGARVEAGGHEVPAAAWGVGWPLNPGVHRVVASKGRRRIETSVEAKESASVSVNLSLPPSEALAPNPPAPGALPAATPAIERRNTSSTPTAPAHEITSSSVQRTWGWVGIAVGGAGLAVGAIAGGIALSKKSSFGDACQDRRCPSAVSGDVDSYNSMRTVSTVGFVAGAVGMGAGLILLFTAKPDNETTTRAGLAPWLGPGMGGVTGRF